MDQKRPYGNQRSAPNGIRRRSEEDAHDARACSIRQGGLRATPQVHAARTARTPRRTRRLRAGRPDRTWPGLSQRSYTPLPFESAAQLVRVFDGGTAKVRSALRGLPDKAWSDPWKLSFQGKTIFEGTRFLAYRQMFLNHIVHHRAQLGVYLRLNNEPLPATYGPSADDRLGF